MRHGLCLLLVACTASSEETQTSDLSADQRLARETIVRDVAAQGGLHNGMLLAGIAEAEVHLAHCWAEATWACPGPASFDCGGGAVVAGSADGDCSLQRGGLGMFQFDSGTYADTLAVHGQGILGVGGSTSEALNFVVDMVIRSAYTPTTVVDRPSALAWLDGVTIDGPTYDAWLKTVVQYYNGCAPGVCSAYFQRRQAYDTAFRTVLAERGAAWWGGAQPGGSTWLEPVAHTWMIDFNIVNPSVPGFSSCFGVPLAQLVHSGEDWANAAGTPVRAIGAGTVVFAQFFNYPGSVVVVRHDLDAAERAALGIAGSSIWSMYGHLDGVLVSPGQQVAAGQQLASILDQGSNSHLHWEVRTVETPQLCGFTMPGPGYTGPGTDARAWGYLDPQSSVAALSSNSTPPPPPPPPVGWNCADSQWGFDQLWTCGGDGNRHECFGSTPVVDTCAHGCMSRPAGTDDLCVRDDPGWSCASSSWNGGQLWTCSGSSIHQCQGGVPVRVDCPFGCNVNPLGTNDTCR